MQPPWFYCPHLQTGVVVLLEAQARHACLSRRLRPGEAILLFDGCGRVGRATITARDECVSTGTTSTARRRTRPRGPTATVEEITTVPAPTRTLTIISGGCKGARLEWLVEKCTELGVARLTLAEFDRSIVRVGPQHLEKLRRTATEACKQSGRAWLPEITVASGLAQAIAEAAGGVLVVADLTADAEPLAKAFRRHAAAPRITAVVGPEGGLTEQERAVLCGAGAVPVRLAEHVLRVETAAVALAAGFAAAVGATADWGVGRYGPAAE